MNSAVLSFENILQLTPTKSYSETSLSAEDLRTIWKAIALVIQNVYVTKKAVNIVEFGLFTYVQDKRNLASKDSNSWVLAPIFVLSGGFVNHFGLRAMLKPPAVARMFFTNLLKHSRKSPSGPIELFKSIGALFIFKRQNRYCNQIHI